MALLPAWSVAASWGAIALLAFSPLSALAADKSAADYYVRDLPGLPKHGVPIKMHAGSEDGALMEVGPYRVNHDMNLTLNNGSWNEFANLLFVDNPVGTGFSYVNTNHYVHQLSEMANQFVMFLDKFFKIFPEYEHDDIYLAGESFAGQHIPYIAKAILDRNSKKGPSGKWNLSGLLIGNGWISPPDQSDAYLKFSLQRGIIEKGSDKAQQLQNMQRICDKDLATNPGHVEYPQCEDILRRILKLTMKGSGDQQCINMYDVRLKDSAPSCGMNWPPDLKNVGPYLRQPAVSRALNLDQQLNTGWQECNSRVGTAMRGSNSTASVHLLPEILKQVPILLFSGAEDLICNHIGTEQLIARLEWNGGRGFELAPGNWAPRRQWTFEGENAGFWQEARNLTYVLYYNASHMVAFDHARRTRDMLDRFMNVDISNIGGEPSDSRIDGEKGPDTSVGGATNNTHHHQEETKKKLENAKWRAYQRSGEVVLGIVIIAAVAWGVFIWRQRRKGAAYSALRSDDAAGQSRAGLSAYHDRRHRNGDLEAAAFDEAAIDNIPLQDSLGPGEGKYSIGGDSDEEEEEPAKKGYNHGQ
ncbi:hypothetical protein UVI_02059950 [Ustilaginoidea virens]|uniref:Pheromone-processing carboxypeptidase KEX1 n=1 Tax=Ustilaginoidea virens TaxID=1159556 RepID=A0A1B5L3J0_USTVR|nr:hypothetical protein UVI_02059950 [Ustilaginoidea virens]